jgi:arylsulfatase A-like enzyme
MKSEIKLVNTLIALGISSLGMAQKENRPNIIVILCDDMGYSDTGCYGSEIPTPNIDKLAKEGMQFTQFYANPRSCPTRASLLTGQYPTNAGVGQMDADYGIPEYQGYLRRDCITIAEALKTNGYATYMSGKWHLGSGESQWPIDRGFDHAFSFLGGATDYYEPKGMALDNKRIEIKDPKFYMTDAITENALKYINYNQKDTKPFFMYVAYTAPHWPLQAPQSVINKYKDFYKKGWDNIRLDRFNKMKSSKIISDSTKLSPRHKAVPAWNTLSEKAKEDWSMKMAIYASMIDILDKGVGSIVSELKKQKIYDNTVIMFLSDNGACPFPLNTKAAVQGAMPGGKGSAIYYDYNWANVSNTPYLFFKRWTHEGGINVPFIIRYPKIIAPNTRCDIPVHVIDILPTCMDIAKAKYPDNYGGNFIKKSDGLTLLPLLMGQTKPIHNFICWEHNGNKAIRKGDWKLVYNNDPDARSWELYNILQDRSEFVDLSAKNPEKVNELKLDYEKWMNENKVIQWDELTRLVKQKRNGLPLKIAE